MESVANMSIDLSEEKKRKAYAIPYRDTSVQKQHIFTIMSLPLQKASMHTQTHYFGAWVEVLHAPMLSVDHYSRPLLQL